MIRRIINKIKKEASIRTGTFIHIDSPQVGQSIATPFIKVTGVVISDSDIDLSQLAVMVNNDSHTVYEISRPDVIQHYPKKRSAGFQVVIPGDTVWGNAPKLQIVYQDKNYHSYQVGFNQEVFKAYVENKSDKKVKIGPLLTSQFGDENGAILSVSKEVFDQIETTGNVSDHDYDSTAKSIIEEYKDGLILDAGCGLRSVYYPNVVNLEIVDYPTTDVVGFADQLPFPDNTFDAVFSLNVLEHVRDPFSSAKELERVLKPGGKMYVAVPFLQPFHGYPNHYYNMTTSGLKNLFSDNLTNVECGVLEAGHPIYALSWMLGSYKNGLSVEHAKKFGELTVNDLLKLAGKPQEELVKLLKAEVQEELSCVNYLLAEKL